MKLCEHNCIPCCDFCIHVIYDYYQEEDGYIMKLNPIGCNLHTDTEHQQIAEGCGSCEDFWCFNVKRRK